MARQPLDHSPHRLRPRKESTTSSGLPCLNYRIRPKFAQTSSYQQSGLSSADEPPKIGQQSAINPAVNIYSNWLQTEGSKSKGARFIFSVHQSNIQTGFTRPRFSGPC
ncbi:hypothetical protein PoB_001679400 [Plakobranchus ocellatus]|uniref:Uncharacterized protein n=1 Tax=Plakobranchus ocellatus TaxID=259542 RepID=A0AAV3Z7C5_9GAST|nr:hypothetical protein PoB_001679400 [Plakobranchus ocellatus]